MTAPPTGRRELNRQHTRQRIVDATVQLHTTVGPSRTTIAGIAERAGVQRHTVYAHFPDERELYRACVGHWLGGNPPPDDAGWAAIADLQARAAAVLGAVYAYWERTADDLGPILADAARTPALAEAGEWWRQRISSWVAAILGGGRRRVRAEAAAVHALQLTTWRSLTDAGLGRPEAVDLMASLIEVAAAPAGRA